MRNNLQQIILIVVCFLLVYFLISKCNNERKLKNEVIEISKYKDTAMVYKSRNGKLITYNKAVEIDLGAARETISGLNDMLHDLKLKKPTAIIKTRTEVNIDTILIPVTDTLPCDEFTYSTNVDSEYYNMNITLTNKSILLNNISIPNEQSIVTGIKKNGLFKKNEFVVTIQNSNPYLKNNRGFRIMP